MQTLAIYDTTGKIIYQGSGNMYEPVGIPFIKVEIPEGKILTRIDTSTDPHTPVYIDASLANVDSMTLEQLKAFQIDRSKSNLEQYLKDNPITSDCHGSIEKPYTITKDKQTQLTQMILITQVALSAGMEYQPSWNAQGEPCTYDWTMDELQQLAFEIESVVRPLVSHQQTIEAYIKAATTKEDALAISINY